MQAIETRYLGATDLKGSRIVARCEASRIVSSKHQMRATSVEEDHRLVAIELIQKLGWHGHWVQGAVPSNRKGYVFVCYRRMDYDHDPKGHPGLTEGFDVWPSMNVEGN
jgi:hypothetical protein